MSADEPVNAQEQKLSQRLNELVDTVHPPGRGPYSNQEIAQLIEDRGLGSVTPQYIWLLRTGRRVNPTKRHIEALAGFFGVPVAYFFDDAVAEKTAGELKLLSLMRDTQIKSLLLRVSDVSSDGKDAILGLVDAVREREGLPPSN